MPAKCESSPDLVVLNANVYVTSDDRAEAFSIEDGRVTEVGSTTRIAELAGSGTEVLDLKGATVVPGFNDAHIHPKTRFDEDSIHGIVDATGLDTIEDLIQRFRSKAEKVPRNTWIVGFGYQDVQLGRHLTRQDLDQISRDHPIFIAHASLHLAAVNSLSLKLAGLDRTSKSPAGGEYVKDRNGELTGLLKETAAFQFLNLSDFTPAIAPLLPPVSPEKRIAAYIAEFRFFASKGITSINHAGVSLEHYGLYQQLVEVGVPVRIGVMLGEQFLDDAINAGLKTGVGTDHLQVTAVKVFHGNSLSGRTAWLSQPYAHDKTYYGIPVSRSQESLNKLIAKIHRNGFQAAVHANGDREIAMVLDAFEYALQRRPVRDHRFRLEHASVLTPELLDRINALGVVVAPHSYVYEHGDKMESYGSYRWNLMHANHSLLELGIPNAGNSDYPVSAADPLLRIQSLVTRQFKGGKVYGEKQRINPAQAISIWTQGSAYASFHENRLGTLEPGMLADFVVLEKDPSGVELDTIMDIRVLSTFIDGLPVFRLDPLTGEEHYSF